MHFQFFLFSKGTESAVFKAKQSIQSILMDALN